MLEKIFFPKLLWLLVRSSFRFGRPQLYSPDFARDRLWQIDKLQPAHALVWRQHLTAVLEDRESSLARRLAACAQCDKGLYQSVPNGIGRGNHGALHYILVLNQRAFNLKRANAVVGGLKDIIGSANKGEIAFRIALHHIAGAIDRAGKRNQVAIIALIAGHKR